MVTISPKSMMIFSTTAFTPETLLAAFSASFFFAVYHRPGIAEVAAKQEQHLKRSPDQLPDLVLALDDANGFLGRLGGDRVFQLGIRVSRPDYRLRNCLAHRAGEDVAEHQRQRIDPALEVGVLA